ncbi:hypothetical protein [Alicyclobacillus acidoterrestris]|uniref:Uncharacterized protein n=1 Tax=Alicyclobacillus acidoterrestris (strain ATCC 49025 / DSM 3922 / CIP 106132 / NCIMB 13137 / GD3B) TaxID=1356854 RepID=T0BFG0_ALIAG|nr:hypothetical protein [Alicyclobacillus acidoterrestris]EPZ42733.1 hypothetical protein N007_14375 [Alicyclobacillus acidoterrestris ATCC 49025]UNO50116.1 hypothetical protein K1I37_06400 [Alicyclobacillus acidoterrestris]
MTTNRPLWIHVTLATLILFITAGCGRQADPSGGINSDVFRSVENRTQSPLPANQTSNRVGSIAPANRHEPAPPTPSHPAPPHKETTNQSTAAGTSKSKPTKPEARARANTNTTVKPSASTQNTTSNNTSNPPSNAIAGANQTARNTTTANNANSRFTRNTIAWDTKTQRLPTGIVVSLAVPSDWVKYNAAVGDTSGYEWINPANSKQRITLMANTNLPAAAKQSSSNAIDVTKLFKPNPPIQWTSISPDQSSGFFTSKTSSDASGIPLSQTPVAGSYTGYGFVQIVHAQVPTAVVIEAWAPPTVAKTAIDSASIQS